MQRKPRPLFRGFKECSIYLRVAALDGSNLSQSTIHTITNPKIEVVVQKNPALLLP
jgi:hypothetical protein